MSTNSNEKMNKESLDKLIASAKENDIELSVEEAENILNGTYNGGVPLSDEDIEEITGGSHHWTKEEMRRKFRKHVF